MNNVLLLGAGQVSLFPLDVAHVEGENLREKDSSLERPAPTFWHWTMIALKLA
jgi:hypothetical protein